MSLLSERRVENMPATTAPPPQSLFPDEQPLAQYRSIAPIALVAAGLGAASAVILTTPLLALVPVAGIVTSIVALRTIARSEGQLAGRLPAIIGLSLATFFLGFGLSRHLARQSVMEQRAREMTDVWIGLLEEGKVKEAHQFRETPAQRLSAPQAIAERYATNPEAASQLKTFINSPGIKDIVARGKAADVRFEGVASASRDGQSDMLVLRYSYLTSSDKGADRQPLWIHMNRRYDDATKRYEWETGGVQTTPPLGVE
jgi:hypothetical protein